MNDKTTPYFVNGEEQSTESKKLTVKQILENAGFTPAEDFRLTRDNGSHDFSDYTEEVPIHKYERFTATFKGVTPTS
jgi:ribose 5-phosphate isomerase RpiB